MKKSLLILWLFFYGCVPTHLDASISFGENQTIERTIKVSHQSELPEVEEKLSIKKQPEPLSY
jgi:hypothetical protein